MKRFIKNVLKFSLLIIVVSLLFEIYLRSMPTDYERKLSGITDNYQNIELLILGNSHAFRGVDPREFDLEAYNMAAVNQSLYFDKRIALKHIDKMPNLKFILMVLVQVKLEISRSWRIIPYYLM